MSLGKPVTILTFNTHKENEQKVILEEKELEGILLHPEVKDRKVVVFSILGVFRQGKSFLLGYVLRFLYANVSSIQKIVTKYF
jgi:atlastin